jgi:hypothetical protein
MVPFIHTTQDTSHVWSNLRLLCFDGIVKQRIYAPVEINIIPQCNALLVQNATVAGTVPQALLVQNATVAGTVPQAHMCAGMACM